MNTTQPRIRDWYSVSASALRRWGLFAGLILVVLVGVFAYTHWQREQLESAALNAIARASSLLEEMDQRGGSGGLPVETLRSARELLEEARIEHANERFGPSLDLARSCLGLLEPSDANGSMSDAGATRFHNVSGNVEYRRGERGAWKRARTRDVLQSGDWIKTSDDSTAQIIFGDGAFYTLRENTMVHLGSNPSESGAGTGEKAPTAIHWGWVELNTSQSSRTVSTPSSEARVEGDSEALVAYDEKRKQGRFAAYQGSMEVTSAAGQSLKVAALQQVDQNGDRLGEPKALPDAPQLSTPTAEQLFDFDRDERFQLAWQPVAGASRYVLQVASNRLFSPALIDAQDRTRNQATVGIRAQGSFYWKVAAVARNGARGPWSETRTFRVASLRGSDHQIDDTPPALEIRSFVQFGNLLIVSGKTEPGATVTVGGEPVSVEVDGSFKKTIQLTREGSDFVDFVATDAAGNEERQRKTVYVDTL
ncbi:MAG: hypothetical protein HC897_05310 [Thermoanaerobaculia bacterium]|nr:hypothetical protein [Thermoanaerobaculia bacterium]